MDSIHSSYTVSNLTISFKDIPKFSEKPITTIPQYVFENCNQVTCNQYNEQYFPMIRQYAKVITLNQLKNKIPLQEQFVKRAEELDWVYGLDYLETNFLKNGDYLKNPTAFTTAEIIKINGLFSRFCNDTVGEYRSSGIHWPKFDLDVNQTVILGALEKRICATRGEEWFGSL